MTLISSTDQTIAHALYYYLEDQLRSYGQRRTFFRCSGFTEAIYTHLLDRLASEAWQINGTPLEVRSIETIRGHADRVMEPNYSATWYRNTLSSGRALILIQNRLSSDAQSLKDLFEITEPTLAQNGIKQLIRACFTSYQLMTDEPLCSFVERIARVYRKPQLRDLTEFFGAIDQMLATQPGTSIHQAIVQTLPHLGLFRCRELESMLGTTRGDKLIRQMKQAVRLGNEVIDETRRKAYLDRLDKATLNNDKPLGGLSQEEKRQLLQRFIEGQLRHDYEERLKVLQLDWAEVRQVMSIQSRLSRDEKLTHLADQLAASLSHQEVQDRDVDALIKELRTGREPEQESIEQLLREHEQHISAQLRNQLRRLMKHRSSRYSDFLVGVVSLAVELMMPYQDQERLQPGMRLQVNERIADINQEEGLREALSTFRVLYGGCETAMPSVSWQLQSIWDRLKEQEDSESDETIGIERETPLGVPFRVSLLDAQGREVAYATLLWIYRSDSPAAVTRLALEAEYKQLRELQTSVETCFRIPCFNNYQFEEERISDLDLSRPLQSLGTWYEQPASLRDLLINDPQKRAIAKQPILDALSKLERAWGDVATSGTLSGLLSADIYTLLIAYEDILRSALTSLQTAQDSSAGLRILNQAWIVGLNGFRHGALMPMLHPLKLYWWRERARYFDSIVTHLLDPAHQAQLVDEVRYRRELSSWYGSSGFPAILALPTGGGRPVTYFLPTEELEGYELFLPMSEDHHTFGSTADALADDETELVAPRTVAAMIAVILDYLETYPFVADGLTIVLFDCRHGALPGLLAQQLTQQEQLRDQQSAISIIVHTYEHGAVLFQRVSEWVSSTQALPEQHDGYIPRINLSVFQGSNQELLALCRRSDIVILSDLLVQQGQKITSELVSEQYQDLATEGYLPINQVLPEPFHIGDLDRRLLLSQPHQTCIVRMFLLTQHTIFHRRPRGADGTALFYRELTLDNWEQILYELHDDFNWVICYDPTIDRFLLKARLGEKAEVIRYSLGLGAKRQYNLTVSSSRKTQHLVEQRLATRLASLLPQADPPFRTQVAHQLVEQAKAISGDIVLRAAGPGAFLNELIGLVVAKFETERHYKEQHPDDLITWVLLDDVGHWFRREKFPDLLFVAIAQTADGVLRLHLSVLEAKCVGERSFANEANDAQIQVDRGLMRLVPAFTPGGKYLDANYWYDQLYRAVTGNLQLDEGQRELWELFREKVIAGHFQCEIDGHSWVFCYDGQVGISHPQEQPFSKELTDLPTIRRIAHSYGRNELCQSLRALIEANKTIAHRPEMWQAAKDVSIQKTTLITTVETTPTSITSNSSEIPSSPLQPEPQPDLIQQNEEQSWLKTEARELERALQRRNIQLLPIDPILADVGPSVVRFKLQLRSNETLKRVQSIAEDLARDLALKGKPFIANVPGTRYIGIDLPRKNPELIQLQPLLNQLDRPGPGELHIILGKTPDGRLHIGDLSTFPHLLVAGSTGSGKSVFLRNLLISLISQYAPGQLELLIIDPKRTDFTFFDQTPYMRGGKVIVEGSEAREALIELVHTEMPHRQKLMAGRSTNIKLFNSSYPQEAIPPVVALIDEYALLANSMDKRARDSLEQDLSNLAAAARSVGIHLVLATQHPNAEIVTPKLKANLDARAAFRVASNTNSRVVLDEAGAEDLLGRGDMLLRHSSGELLRLQAPFMDEQTVQAILNNRANKNS